ncbi:thiamine diphosphokinase [Tissierella pigra]|uniref:Thiamine diphosphokinase n=1 Tax=Tissierella pigra TaxID=2607614 RepID=A0A6N7XE88_9FIRM|nr:thiamine diphosphokinase [Tissierella pigra]MBU5426487.1 thiamine diphosphokinase [Tissierella pigra]MSU00066.1 thiamine diphosphokinase [Tissierella pigra]
MKGLIVSSGTITNYNRLKEIINEVDYIICADGGMEHLMKINKLPNVILGDLDSISKLTLEYIVNKNIPIEKYSSIKDSTDTELAMEYLIDRGCDEIVLMGVTGTRQDHTMASILLLDTLYNRGIKANIVDDNNIIYLTDNYLEIEHLEGHYTSVIPISNTGIIVSLKGFFYNLDNKLIPFGSTLGISNKIVEDIGIVKIHKGKALIFISKD